MPGPQGGKVLTNEHRETCTYMESVSVFYTCLLFAFSPFSFQLFSHTNAKKANLPEGFLNVEQQVHQSGLPLGRLFSQTQHINHPEPSMAPQITQSKSRQL